MADATILVVDDEPDIRGMLSEYLSNHGYQVLAAEGADAARAIVNEKAPDIILLDIHMPGEDGLSLARYLRERFDVGIIMVTAASDVVDRIVGLEMGADDYIAKPFDLRELLARIKSVLRRYQGGRAPAGDRATSERVPFGHCILDLATRQLFDGDGEEISLTNMEFELLEAFAASPNRVLTRDQILNLTQNRDWDPYDRSIDIRIARLRRKIESDPERPRIIKTVRGAGYMFDQETDRRS